jgi:hypothetical protein
LSEPPFRRIGPAPKKKAPPKMALKVDLFEGCVAAHKRIPAFWKAAEKPGAFRLFDFIVRPPPPSVSSVETEL